MIDDKLLLNFTLSAAETAVMYDLHEADSRIAELMGKKPHPDALRTLLAVGKAWLHRVHLEGGPEAMAGAMALLERERVERVETLQ